MCWNKFNDQSWYKFDDERVEVVTIDEILSLSGGGDFHSAYILVWQRKAF